MKLQESIFDNERYEEIKSKTVYDTDGFTTDYTMYYDNEEDKFIFMFGDKELYTPDSDYADWECETEQEAEEWFSSYGEDEEEKFDDDFIYDDEPTIKNEFRFDENQVLNESGITTKEFPVKFNRENNTCIPEFEEDTKKELFEHFDNLVPGGYIESFNGKMRCYAKPLDNEVYSYFVLNGEVIAHNDYEDDKGNFVDTKKYNLITTKTMSPELSMYWDKDAIGECYEEIEEINYPITDPDIRDLYEILKLLSYAYYEDIYSFMQDLMPPCEKELKEDVANNTTYTLGDRTTNNQDEFYAEVGKSATDQQMKDLSDGKAVTINGKNYKINKDGVNESLEFPFEMNKNYPTTNEDDDDYWDRMFRRTYGKI